MEHKIYIASDHAGYELKKQLIELFIGDMSDLGTNSKDSVDYPDYSNLLCKNMKSDNKSFGILICGTGIGMSISANRHSHIRAGLASNPEVVTLMREHNDANVLVLPGRFINVQEALKCVNIFLEIKYSSGRHQQRINKLKI